MKNRSEPVHTGPVQFFDQCNYIRTGCGCGCGPLRVKNQTRPDLETLMGTGSKFEPSKNPYPWHGFDGYCGDCYCHITGCSSCIPSISNYILASDNHENVDNEREEQQRQRQGGASQMRLDFFFLLLHYLLTTSKQQKYEKWRGGTHLLVLPIFNTARRSNFRHSEKTPTSSLCCYSCFHHNEEVPTPSCRFRCDEEAPTSSFFTFSMQRGGTHLLVVSLFLFLPQVCHSS